MRRLLLALVAMVVVLLATAPASARVAPLDPPLPASSGRPGSRLGLHGTFAVYTYRLALEESRLASGKTATGLRLASDPTLRWKGRPRYLFGGTEVYDMRARQWVPELGTFLSIDDYAFHDARSTLWGWPGWPGQNPIRWRDPSGRFGNEDLFEFERLGGFDYLAGFGTGLLDTVPLCGFMPFGPSLGDVSDALGLSGKHPKRSNANAGPCAGGGGGDDDDPAGQGRTAGIVAGSLVDPR